MRLLIARPALFACVSLLLMTPLPAWAADTTPPTASLTAPTSDMIVSGKVVLAATASDETGVHNVQFLLDSRNIGARDTTAPYTITWDTRRTTDGLHAFGARVRDAAGNQALATPVQVVVDNTPPSVPSGVLVTPVDQTTLQIAWDASSDNIQLSGYQVELSTTSDFLTAPLARDVGNVTSASIGELSASTTYYVRVRAYDGGNNLSTYSAAVSGTTQAPPDTQAPTISLSAPSAGSVVTGTTNVSVNAADNVGVFGVQFLLDGGLLGPEQTLSPYTLSWNTSQIPNGWYTLTALARDAAGNETIAPALSIVVGNSAPQVRDWRSWPFSQTSPWNQPTGSNAQYADVPGLTALPITTNYQSRWTASIVMASDTDPQARILFTPAVGPQSVYTFLETGGLNCGNPPAAETQLLSWASTGLPFEGNYYSTLSIPDTSLWLLPADYHRSAQDYRSTLRLPAGACPSPDSDGMLVVMQPDGWVLDLYASVVTSTGQVIGTMGSYLDGRGEGTGWWNGRRASMLPSFAGLIRKGELAAGLIPHALVMQAPPALLKNEAVWPAATFDRNSGYTGTLPMGSLLAIPPTVNLDTLGLSPKGRMIAKAAQDYGVYVADRGGSGLTMLAELNNPEIPWQGPPATWQDLERIRNQLKQVTNNTPTTPGGGGTLRAPLAPPFIDGIMTSTPPTPDTVAPEVPTGLVATPIDCNRIGLSWSGSMDEGISGMKGYQVYRNGALLKQVLAPATTTQNGGLIKSTTYSYSVSALDNAGNESVRSLSASATTPSCS